jgi:DNA-binding transcriptional LysR family regulator
MDSERLASADLAEGVSFALSPPQFRFPVNDLLQHGLSSLPLRHWSWQKPSPLPDMAEGASFAAYSCTRRHMVIEPCYGRDMSHPDLNLLVTLDVLLAEGSVARAARRLRLSPSAMSRALARLRETTGDPLLVRAGRGLVPTPRALELRERVGQLVQDAQAVLHPANKLDLARLVRTFTLRTSEGFVETFGPSLIARVSEEAPGVRLCFLPKPDKDSTPLREGSIDLETGVVGKTTGPEVRARGLFRDRFIGAVRPGHPLSEGEVTPARYAAGRHILVSRRGPDGGPIDEALEQWGLAREIATIVGGFSTALALARSSDLIATVPERHTQALRAGMHSFSLPVPVPEITVSLLWHPRLDADPAHRWLRECVRVACSGPLPDPALGAEPICLSPSLKA